MTEADLLSVIKELVVQMAENDSAKGIDAEKQLLELRKRVAELRAETPVGELGWDSLQMTWLLVRLEERFEIDTSSITMFDVFTVGDLLKRLVPLIDAREAKGG